MLLDKDQIRLIESDVQHARITLAHLSDELVDHICCEVEKQMNEGKNFDEAYSLIKKETGIKILQEIQENTLYLINKKYAVMKTTMKITGNISLVLLGVGALSRLMHLPGADLLLVVGFVLLCLVFFPMAIYFNYNDQEAEKKLILNLSLLAGGIFFMSGILLKIMVWPGSNLLLLLGWIFILGIFLPFLLYAKLREATRVKEKAVYVIGALSLFIFELSSMFKFFNWEGSNILMFAGSAMLVSVFLPMYTFMKFKQSKEISAQFIFLIIISMYAVAMTTLISLHSPSAGMTPPSHFEMFITSICETLKIYPL
jgi:hypothetical protein